VLHVVSRMIYYLNYRATLFCTAFFHGKYDGQHYKANNKQPPYTAAASRHSKPLNYKLPTMDDMPLPYGNWKEHHAKTNRYYNRVLLFGFFSLVVSILIVSIPKTFRAGAHGRPFVARLFRLSREACTIVRGVAVKRRDFHSKNFLLTFFSFYILPLRVSYIAPSVFPIG